jgi:hypothetical protein
MFQKLIEINHLLKGSIYLNRAKNGTTIYGGSGVRK